MKLPLIEEFYSLQGEGFHIGKAAYFLRLSGCDIRCDWCDTKMSWSVDIQKQTTIDEIVKKAILYPAKTVVVTGGEPLLYNLTELCIKLKAEKITIYLETSGAYNLTGQWDWICLSPKKKSPPQKSIIEQANELKIVITDDEDFIWAEKYAKLVNSECHLYLQAEWSNYKKITKKIFYYILNNPKWKISMQAHKFIKIP